MAEKKNEAQNEQDKEKKKKGVIIGVIGLAAAAAVAVPLGLKGCAPGEKSFTVTFLTDEEVEGFHQGSMNVKDGTTIGSLKNQLAPLEGYDFAGFYKDENCTTPFDDSEVVTDNTKIYVAYEEKKFTLKFYNEGEVIGGEPIATIDVYYYKTIKQSLAIDGKDTSMPKPTKTEGDYGYEFTGWQVFGNVEKVFHNKDFQSMKGKDILQLDADGEAELVATFSATKERLYTVTYDENLFEVKKGNEPIKTGDKVLSGSRLTIVSKGGGDFGNDYIMSFKVEGANEEDGLYHVTGNVSIEAVMEHRYLEFTLLENDTYEVKGMKEGATETNIVIPATFNGKKVTSIYGKTISWAVGEGAFYNNTTITSVTIGENITHIGEFAFYNCTALTKILWNAVEVEDFAGVPSGTNYIFWNAGQGGNGIEVVFGDSVKKIPAHCFDSDFYSPENNPNIISMIIGKNVTSIGYYAFANCQTLISVVIGKSVTSIETGAFNDCYRLAEVINLSTLNISAGDSGNGDVAYHAEEVHKNSESKLQIIDGVHYYDNGVDLIAIRPVDLNCTNIKIDDRTTKIKGYAFYNCRSLTTVTIGERVTSIGDSAFFECTALTKIEWNAVNVADFKSENSVFNKAGQNGEGIEVIFGDSVERIPAYCFYPSSSSGCAPKITSVVIGKNVTSVGDFAFYSCSGVTSIVIGKNVTSIGNNAFYGCSSLTGELVISDSVKSIGTRAFYGCSGLTGIVIGKNVTSIGNDAFYNCTAITKIEWNAVKVSDFATGNSAFSKVGQSGEGIEVIFGDSVEKIPEYCFNPSSTSYAPKITSVVIGNSVTTIGGHAFYSCSSLTSIVIGKNVTSIENDAFYDCSKLKTIYYGGTASDWKSISIGSYNTPLKSSSTTFYYFSEEEPQADGNYWHWSEPDASGVRTPVIWGKATD